MNSEDDSVPPHDGPDDDSIYEAELIVAGVDGNQGDSSLIDETITATEVVDEKPADLAAESPAALKPELVAEETKLLENIAAKGGAVGSFVLGVLAVAGSFITSYSIINAVIGLLLGIWGLQSRHKKLAVLGIILSMVGVVFSAVQINDLIQWWLEVRAEAASETDF